MRTIRLQSAVAYGIARSRCRVSVVLLVLGLCAAMPSSVFSTAIAISSLQFSNVVITPASGTLEFLPPPPWGASAFAQALNSLGEFDSQFAQIWGDIVRADAIVTYADGHAIASALDLTGSAASNVGIPDLINAEASSLGRGTIYNYFQITGGTGPVSVDFSVDIAGDLYVATDCHGVLAQTETIFGWELFGLHSDGTPVDTPILFGDDILTVGPDSSQTLSFARHLSTTVTLAFADNPADPDTPFQYATLLEGDSESEAINVPEPSSLALLLTGCVGLLLAGGFRRQRVGLSGGQMNHHRLSLGTKGQGFRVTGGILKCRRHLLSLLAPAVILLLSADFAEATYLGGHPPPKPCCACDPSNSSPACGCGISISEGNMQDLVPVFSSLYRGGPAASFSLTYNGYNADGTSAQVDTVLGYGWTHSYNIFLFSQLGSMFRMDENGRVTKYQLRAGGTYSPTAGYFETLVQSPPGTFTLRQKDGTTFVFTLVPNTPFMVGGPVYRLIRITDRNNNTTTLTYSAGNLSQVTDTYGRSVIFTYDSHNKLATVVDSLGRTTRFSYDASGRQLRTITDADGKSIQYSYDVSYHITQKIDKDGRTFSFLYDASRHPVAIIDGSGNPLYRLTNSQNWATNSTTLAMNQMREYIPATTTKIDGRGNVWKYDYESHGYITRIIAPDGVTTTFAYNPATLMVASNTDANGHTTVYTYDARGNLLTMTDALGNMTVYTYEPVFNMMTSMTDPKGRVTTYTYDARGNRITETQAVGLPHQRSRSWTYDAHGNALTATDWRGNTTAFTYDAYGNRITSTDPLGNLTTMTYDAEGNMLSRTDANGHTTTFQYDVLDRLIKETDPLGAFDVYSYDGMGDRTQVTDRNGHMTTYQYDLRRRLTQTTDALGHSDTSTYDGNDNRISMTDKNSHTTTYACDVQNRLVRTTDALGNITRMAYDPVSNILTQTDANTHTTTFTYDALNRRLTMTDALGNMTQLQYDTGGVGGCPFCGATPGTDLVTRQADGNGKVTFYKYDDLNRLIKVVRKVGATNDTITVTDAVTSYTYDATDNRLTVTEPDGNTTTDQFDALNRRIKETNAAGDVTQWMYDGVGNVICILWPNGNDVCNGYDADDRLVLVTDSIGPVASYTYDPVGNRLTQTDGNGNTTSYAYDALNRLVTTTDPLGKPTVNQYDPVGNLASVTDRNVHVTTYVYDAINRRTSATDPLAHATSYTYDNVGNLITLTDANGHATAYAYDAINRRIRETYADGGILTYSYDAVNLITRTDQNGQTTTYTYNDLYFLLGRSYPSAVNDTFTYDLSGRMLTANRGSWNVTFNYDGANRLTNTTQNGQTVAYVYDILAGQRFVTYPGGRTILEQTDFRNRLATVDDAGSPPPIVQYSYDFGNRVVTRSYRNGTLATYTYNANDWITGMEHTLSVTRIAGFGYAYDNEGNKQFEQKRHDTGHSEAYAYDNSNRLITYNVGTLVGSTVPVPVTQTAYNLDPVGNWNSKTTDAITQNRTHNAANELTTIGATNLTYDLNGNLLNDGAYAYQYDEENRLTRVTRLSDSTIVGQYLYDALGRRMQKIADPAGVPTTTRYFHDAARIIEEQDGLGATQATYVYGNYIDEVLTMERGGQTYYYHQNALWSVVAMSDSAASVAERYAYDAYGFVTVTDGTFSPIAQNAWGTPHSAIGNSRLFTGRQLDEETGPYYYRARYYDSTLGRYLTRDLLNLAEPFRDLLGLAEPFDQDSHEWLDNAGNELPPWTLNRERTDRSNDYNVPAMTFGGRSYSASVNLYEYARSRPTFYIDPTGRKVEVCIRPAFVPWQWLFVHCFLKTDLCGNWNYSGSVVPEPNPASFYGSKPKCKPVSCPVCVTEARLCANINKSKTDPKWGKGTYNLITHNCCHWVDMILKKKGCKGVETYFPPYTLPSHPNYNN